jgi:hypothetical protein
MLLLAAGYPVVMNWGAVIWNARNRRMGIDKHYSPGPFLSATLASIAYVAYPFGSKQWIFILPAIDIGNWVALVGLATMVRRLFRRS